MYCFDSLTLHAYNSEQRGGRGVASRALAESMESIRKPSTDSDNDAMRMVSHFVMESCIMPQSMTLPLSHFPSSTTDLAY